ncbi:hypothetical protein BD310DRAFT_1010733, partial [Dichomitus squalens]
ADIRCHPSCAPGRSPRYECGPYHVAKRVGTTYTTSLNPYSKPSGAHIITFSGLTKAWPTDSDSSAGSTHWPPYTVEWSWPTSLPSGVVSSAGTAPPLFFPTRRTNHSGLSRSDMLLQR